MRISEDDLVHLRPSAGDLAPNLSIRTLQFSHSWAFFPEELGEDSEDVVALMAFIQLAPPLHPAFKWLAIEHQSGGYVGSHPAFVGVRLALRPEIQAALQMLAGRYRGYRNGYFSIDAKSAKDIADYDARLGELGLDCDYTYPALHEGVYPIDATEKNLAILTDTPPDLALLGDEFTRRPTNFGVYVLARNSD
jgi:hypothetical protein